MIGGVGFLLLVGVIVRYGRLGARLRRAQGTYPLQVPAELCDDDDDILLSSAYDE